MRSLAVVWCPFKDSSAMVCCSALRLGSAFPDSASSSAAWLPHSYSCEPSGTDSPCMLQVLSFQVYADSSAFFFTRSWWITIGITIGQLIWRLWLVDWFSGRKLHEVTYFDQSVMYMLCCLLMFPSNISLWIAWVTVNPWSTEPFE